MRRKTFAKFLGTAASAAILLSSMGIAAVPVSAASEEELRQAAKAYVDANKNAVTPEGLLAAVQAVCPGATLDEENDFFIKHAVPGVTDDDPEYPLNIPGSDGAVAAVFEADGERIGFTAAFPHEQEVIEIDEVAVVGESEGFTYAKDTDPSCPPGDVDYVSGYTGTADKIVFPEGYNSSLYKNIDPADFQSVEVVMIQNTKAIYGGGMKGWENLIAIDVKDGAAPWTLFKISGQYPNSNGEDTNHFGSCPNLKYVRLPETIRTNMNRKGTAIPYRAFKDCPKLENINMSNWQLASGSGAASMDYQAFTNTAVRDFFLTETASIVDSNESFTDPSFGDEGTRNVIAYSEEMTFCRAAALAAAGMSELSFSEDMDMEAVQQAILESITGSADAVEYREGLSCSWNDTWKNTDSFVGGVLSISDGTDSIPLSFGVSKALASLDVGYALTPSFSADITEYAVTVPHDVTSLTVNAQAVSGASVGTITGNADFEVGGSNRVEIPVTTAGGKTVTFTITVTREAAMDLSKAKQAVIDAAAAYNATNDTTQQNLQTALQEAVNAGSYTVTLTDYYMYKSIGGATEGEEVLVPGRNGYIAAIAEVTKGEEKAVIPLMCTVKPAMKNYTFTEEEVSKQEDFHLSSDGKILQWYSGDAKKIVIPEGVEEIDLAWYDGEHPEEVLALILPDSLKVLPDDFCYGMRNLEVVYMGDNITDLPRGTFMSCYFLQYVRLSERLNRLGTESFKYTQALGALHIPDSISEFGKQVFWNSGVRDITLSPNVNYVDSYCFSYAARLWGDVQHTEEDQVRLQAILDQFNKNSRVVTILTEDMQLAAANSFVSNGNPLPGDMIIVRAAAEAEDTIFKDLLHKTVQYEFDLDMSLAEVAARAQYKADNLFLTNVSTADRVLAAVQSAYYSTKVSETVTWKEPFQLTQATDSAKGLATGVLQISDGTNTYDIVLNTPVSMPTEEESNPEEPGNPSTPSDPGTSGDPNEPANPEEPTDPSEPGESDPGESDIPETGVGMPAAGLFLALAAAVLAVVTILVRKKKAAA